MAKKKWFTDLPTHDQAKTTADELSRLLAAGKSFRLSGLAVVDATAQALADELARDGLKSRISDIRSMEIWGKDLTPVSGDASIFELVIFGIFAVIALMSMIGPMLPWRRAPRADVVLSKRAAAVDVEFKRRWFRRKAVQARG